jgi:hypothetical protein
MGEVALIGSTELLELINTGCREIAEAAGNGVIGGWRIDAMADQTGMGSARNSARVGCLGVAEPIAAVRQLAEWSQRRMRAPSNEQLHKAKSKSGWHMRSNDRVCNAGSNDCAGVGEQEGERHSSLFNDDTIRPLTISLIFQRHVRTKNPVALSTWDATPDCNLSVHFILTALLPAELPLVMPDFLGEAQQPD